MSARVLEICVDSVADFDAAVEAGADRIELCSALDRDGLTPSDALLARAAESGVPAVAMLRARDGDFCYDAADRETLLRDAERLRAFPSIPWITGALHADASLDVTLLEELAGACPAGEIVFHRAFDHVPGKKRRGALAQLADLGFSRVLTAGHPAGVRDGIEALEALREDVPPGMTVLVGGGFRAPHMPRLFAAGYRQFHASARSGEPRRLDPALVHSLKDALQRL